LTPNNNQFFGSLFRDVATRALRAWANRTPGAQGASGDYLGASSVPVKLISTRPAWTRWLASTLSWPTMRHHGQPTDCSTGSTGSRGSCSLQ